MTAPTQEFQHVVLMRFPQPLDAAEDSLLRGMVASWPDKIGTMSQCRVGRDLTGERSQGWDYLLYTVFPDEQTFRDYVEHPVHQELVRFLNERGCERLAFDYYFDA
jgi:hypothetical protein